VQIAFRMFSMITSVSSSISSSRQSNPVRLRLRWQKKVLKQQPIHKMEHVELRPQALLQATIDDLAWPLRMPVTRHVPRAILVRSIICSYLAIVITRPLTDIIQRVSSRVTSVFGRASDRVHSQMEIPAPVKVGWLLQLLIA